MPTPDRTFVSIDWDFFVPERVEWDMGHQETSYHLNELWLAWGHLFAVMRTTGQEKDFWKRLPFKLGVKDLVSVSDSHLHVTDDYRLAHAQHLVLVDRHHDVFTDHTGGHRVDCGNWVRWWLDCGKKRTVTWVRPNDKFVFCEVPKHLKSRVKTVRTFPAIKPPMGVHVCRSGCWTPPWLDAAFVRFVKASDATLHPMEDPKWCDPLKLRFSLAHYRTLMEIMRERDKARSAFRAGQALIISACSNHSPSSTSKRTGASRST